MKQKQSRMILVVDDDGDTLLLLQTTLKEYVITTCSPHKAVSIMEHEGVNLLITDYSMPELDGLSLAKTAKRVYGIPSIIITGHTDHASKLRTYKEVDAVMTKPVDTSKLKLKIIQTLDKYYGTIEKRETELA